MARPKKDLTKWVYAKTPDGMRRHGFIEGSTFVRGIEGKYVRCSDQTFPLNTSVIGELLHNEVITLQFRYRMAEQLKIYEISLSQATHGCSIVKNERGEENIRIPIEMCKLVKTVKYPAGSPGGLGDDSARA